MKNMNFMLKGLMKATLMVAMLFVGHSLTAQSISTQSAAYSQSTQTKGTTSTGASFAAPSEAVVTLKTEADALSNQTGNEAENSLRAAYYTVLAKKIQDLGSVGEALNSSASDLANIFARFKLSALSSTEAEIFQDATDLVSN